MRISSLHPAGILLTASLLLVAGCPDNRPRNRGGDASVGFDAALPPPGDAGPFDAGFPPLEDAGGFDAGPIEPGDEGALRVAGGSSVGRLEVFHEGQWGTICDDSFEETDATVACRQLGFAGGAVITAEPGVDPTPIWMDDVACVGTETRLVDCPFPGFAVENCSHSEDVGVECF